MKPWQWLLAIFFWALFVAIIDRHTVPDQTQFMIKLIARFVQNSLALIPSFYLIDYLRHFLKRLRVSTASMYVLLILMTNTVISMLLVLLILLNFGWFNQSIPFLVSAVILHTLIAAGFTIAALLFFLRRYRQIYALKQAFEHRLKAQDDVMKARIAPHFFFNTINTLMSLIETNPSRAADLLQHVSALFRASFNGAREISFEEEVALCEHYLAIESSRLADKLNISWQLPDEDVMYDMAITALTLQSVIEKMLLSVVEMTTEMIYITINATWQQHRVVIEVEVKLPKKTLIVNHDLRKHMNFHIQAERLRSYFGQSADIQSTVTNTQIVTIIDYPLQDVSV